MHKPLVLHFFAVALPGGSELGTLELIRRQRGFRHHIVFLESAGEVSRLYEEAGFPTNSLDLKRHGWWRARQELELLLTAARPAILHCYGLRPGILGRVTRSTASVVQAVHSVDVHRPFWQALIDRLTGRRVALFITNTEAGARFLTTHRRVPRGRIAVVRNGIDPAPFEHARTRRDLVRHALGVDAAEQVVVTIGNLRSPKAYDVLVEAAAFLRTQRSRFVWWIAGQGPDEEGIRGHIERLGLENHVRLLGLRRDVPDLLAAADLFCLTSRREGSPLAILEAMAAGRAVVATDVGGVGELITHEETGLLVPSEEPEAVAVAIHTLLADDARRQRMESAARTRARASHDLDAAAGATTDLYRGLTGGG